MFVLDAGKSQAGKKIMYAQFMHTYSKNPTAFISRIICIED